MKIEFKTKSYINALGIESIKIPEITKNHCDMCSFRDSKKFGAFANSDMFLIILNRELKKMGIDKYLRLDNLPNNVSIENGFLKTVTIKLQE